MTTGFLCMRTKLLRGCMKASDASSGRQPLIMSDMCSFLHMCFSSQNTECLSVICLQILYLATIEIGKLSTSQQSTAFFSCPKNRKSYGRIFMSFYVWIFPDIMHNRPNMYIIDIPALFHVLTKFRDARIRYF